MNHGMTRLLLLITGLFLINGAGAQIDSVQVSGGRLAEPEVRDSGVRVFKGIPFAAPPAGDLRWRPPQPVQPWSGTRSANEFGDSCIQPDGMGRVNLAVIPGAPPLSEDCLYLNVWTPAGSPDADLPVMVWFYGGLFTEGAGSIPLYDGEALATKDVIIVTMNYRLGPFGFLAHPALTAESPQHSSGNYGLLDMLASLQWVQNNIAAFGGDPDNVTVFGESAGAMAIAALVTSPLAEGLFDRAISQSGAWMGLGPAPMATLANAEQAGKRQADTLNASSPAALRALPAEAVSQLPGSGMIIDGWVLPDNASRVFERGDQLPVDVLVGSNKDEGSFIPFGPNAEQWQAQLQATWGDNAEAAAAFYPASDDTVAAASSARAFSDGASWHMRQYAAYQAQQGNSAWAYYLAFEPPVAEGTPNLKAAHTVDLPYVFNNLGAMRLFPDTSSPELALASEDAVRLAERMSTYWVNFARTGNPNGEGLPQWPAYEDINSPVMVLDASPAPENRVNNALWQLYRQRYDALLR